MTGKKDEVRPPAGWTEGKTLNPIRGCTPIKIFLSFSFEISDIPRNGRNIMTYYTYNVQKLLRSFIHENHNRPRFKACQVFLL